VYCTVAPATGIYFTPEQVQQVGERVNNIARLFNIREGFNREAEREGYPVGWGWFDLPPKNSYTMT
jgi:aldehyde:ferredoxin oxidoreductase